MRMDEHCLTELKDVSLVRGIVTLPGHPGSHELGHAMLHYLFQMWLSLVC